MIMKKIKISNFKSFDDLEIELSKFNVLIGANASGKSNFVQIFKFLRDIANQGLDNAISNQGGVEYFRNISVGSSKNFILKVVCDVSDQKLEFLAGKKGEKEKKEEPQIRVKIREIIYEFAIKFTKRKIGFEISKDMLTLECDFFKVKIKRINRKKRKIEEKEKIGSGKILFTKVGGKLKVATRRAPIEKKAISIFPVIYSLLFKKAKWPPRTLLLTTPFFIPIPPFKKLFDNVSIYDFVPKLPKEAVPITGKMELEENGSNLAIVLKNIIDDKEKKRKFYNLVKDLLPFVDEFKIEKFVDKFLHFKLREKYVRDLYLPAYSISDGTINVTALIIALYFGEKWLTVIEEPGRNVHPYLISKIVSMMEDASKETQIIVTTHNPEIVKHSNLKSILLVHRDKKGFSKICKPSDKDEVKAFLESEMGVEELFVQNLLGT